MRALRRELPTELDMNQARLEINSLSEQETTLEPQLRKSFRDQLRSAENQLRVIRAEMASPILDTASKSVELRKVIVGHWSKLSSTLTRAEAYCV